MREQVAAKIGRDREDRIDVIHNWADGEKIRPLAEGERNAFAEEHGLRGRFVVQFSGNFGRVNDFDTPLEAAGLLKDRAGIVFLFIGDGAKAGEIKEYVRRHDLDNVLLLPYQPRETLLYSLAAGDAHLVTLAEGLAGLSVPSKTYGILAAGRPVLFVGDARSDVARIIAENRCGEVVSTGDAARMAGIIAAWADDLASVERLGREARELFLRRFDRTHAVDAYSESLFKCLGPEPLRGARIESSAEAKALNRNP
jgi:glycosyltransferase involved in cell wall biosynthesis